jgi:hypothetical protein
MRLILLTIFSMSLVAANAQTGVPYGFGNTGAFGMGYRPSFIYQPSLSDSTHPVKKWSLNKYGGISADFMAFRGGSGSVISAPMGLQLTRRLNNNLYAFAGVSAAPAYFSMNQPLSGFNMSKTDAPGNNFRRNAFGIYSKAEAGLMYINDERTFSISGSIGVSNNYYQGFHSSQGIVQRQPRSFSGTNQ